MDLGLALGAGGARGLAHAGLLRALTRAGVRPACVAGTSIGALIGAVYCGGDLDGFCRYVGGLTRLDAIKLADPVFPRSGLFEGARFMRRLRRFLTVERLEDCSPRLAVVTVRARDSAPLVLTTGPILAAVRASMAVPGVLVPGVWQGEAVFDGALADPLPVRPCRDLGAGAVVAVDVSRDAFPPEAGRGGPSLAGALKGGAARLLAAAGIRLKPGQRVAVDMLAGWLEDEGRDAGPNIVEAILGAFTIAQRSIKAERMRQDPPEHTVTPDVGSIGFLDFHRGAEALAAGEAAAAGLLQALRPANT
jgi:NTE family protein